MSTSAGLSSVGGPVSSGSVGGAVGGAVTAADLGRRAVADTRHDDRRRRLARRTDLRGVTLTIDHGAQPLTAPNTPSPRAATTTKRRIA